MSHPLGVFLGAKSGEQFLTDFDQLSGAIVVRGFLESREFYGARDSEAHGHRRDSELVVNRKAHSLNCNSRLFQCCVIAPV